MCPVSGILFQGIEIGERVLQRNNVFRNHTESSEYFGGPKAAPPPNPDEGGVAGGNHLVLEDGHGLLVALRDAALMVAQQRDLRVGRVEHHDLLWQLGGGDTHPRPGLK